PNHRTAQPPCLSARPDAAELGTSPAESFRTSAHSTVQGGRLNQRWAEQVAGPDGKARRPRLHTAVG
ncbi:hypothetical protein, partial [Kribbella albertanoniae]|uniref:hypothetical protein n=1 Tax=Kribbella albertanoniae TaxID=1266829 RepID=UPI001EDDCB83